MSLTFDDYSRLASIYEASFPESTTVWSAEDLQSHAMHATGGVIAHENGGLIYQLVAGEAEILSIFVDPGARRRGVGRELMVALLENLAQVGAQSVFLEVDATNSAAIELYQMFEFQSIGVRKAYYRLQTGEYRDACVMKLTFDS